MEEKTMSYVLSEHYDGLKEDLKAAIDNATKIVKRNIKRYASGDIYPLTYEKFNKRYYAGKQADIKGKYWTEGFWTGQLWLSYELTCDEAFRELAEKNVEDFYKRVYDNNNIDWHHDTGFLYTPSCVSAYKLTGNKTAKDAALMAANSLSRRFRYKGNFIQSMSTEIDKENYRFIVDTLLNLPLLFWATEETGDEIYREKAIAHMKTTLKYAMREDGTTFHHVLMNNQTGEMIRGLTWQGAGDESCWSRGQAWVIYGLALAYGKTKDESIIEPFKKAADYFFNYLPKDSIPFWDFIFKDGDDEPRDSSAAAIAACGIMEMAKHLSSEQYGMQDYLDKTKAMMDSLIKKYAIPFEDEEEGLLYHVTGAKPQGDYDKCENFADYYFLECLIRADRDWKAYW